MNCIEISGLDNNAVKLAVKIKNSAKARRENGLFFAEGLRLCGDAAKNGNVANTVFFTKEFADLHQPLLSEICIDCPKCCMVTDGVMKKLSDTVNPQGVVALYKIPEYLPDLTKGFYIALENIADPSNIGAVARSAEAFGADGLILSKGCCDPYSPKSLRAGMGALLRLPVVIVDDLTETIDHLNKSDVMSYASVVNITAEDVRQVPRAKNGILLIGNEANGLSDATVGVATHRVTIPMSGRAESLNASAAASVLIWELLKDRRSYG